MKKRLPILLLLAAAAGGGYWYWQKQANAVDPNSIAVSGNLELTQVDLSFKIPGRIVELKVREGDWVKAGDIIARLDADQLAQQKMRDEASVTAAQSSLAQLRTAIEFQRAQIESDVALRHAELAQTEARLEELLAGSRSQEIAQARAALADATAARDWANTEWERAQTLFRDEDISRAQYDQARTRLDSANAQLRASEQKLALVEEGPRKEEIAAARAQVARARAAISAAEANRIEVRRKEQELNARRAEIDRNQAQVGITQAQIDDTTIVAPIDGVVLVKAAELGEIVAAGTTLVSIGDLEHPWLRAYINGPDQGRVKIGDKATLSTDAGKTYEGRVSFISPEAEFTPKQIQTEEERVKMVYRIKIEVDNSKHELNNNMPVDARIHLGS